MLSTTGVLGKGTRERSVNARAARGANGGGRPLGWGDSPTKLRRARDALSLLFSPRRPHNADPKRSLIFCSETLKPPPATLTSARMSDSFCLSMDLIL